jgi:hypothetical protein
MKSEILFSIVDISGIFGYDVGIVGWTAEVTP